MSIEVITKVLAWCTTINLALLLLWYLLFSMAHDWLYRFHGKWYKLSLEKYDAVNYGGIAFYKILFLVFNLIPYLALRIVC
jgi:hypothetical protein